MRGELEHQIIGALDPRCVTTYSVTPANAFKRFKVRYERTELLISNQTKCSIDQDVLKDSSLHDGDSDTRYVSASFPSMLPKLGN